MAYKKRISGYSRNVWLALVDRYYLLTHCGQLYAINFRYKHTVVSKYTIL